MLFSKCLKTICSNQNCGLSRTQAIFLLRNFLRNWRQHASVLHILLLIVSNRSLRWNQLLRRMKANPINTVMKRRTTFMQPFSLSLAILFNLIYSRACCPQITKVKCDNYLAGENIYKSLNVVCKQNTFWNVKRDIWRRESTASIAYLTVCLHGDI